jgi:hypothetical protein
LRGVTHILGHDEHLAFVVLVDRVSDPAYSMNCTRAAVSTPSVA